MLRPLHPRFQQHLARVERRRRVLAGSAVASIVVASSALAWNVASPDFTSRATETARANSAAVASAFSSTLRDLFCRWFDCANPEAAPQLVEEPRSLRHVAPAALARQPIRTPEPPTAPSTPAPSQHVIERAVERVETARELGSSILDGRLLALEQKLTGRMDALSLAGAYRADRTAENIGDQLNFDELSNITLRSPTIEGGSISGATISGTLANVINAASATIASLAADELIATNATTTTLYVSGTATIGSGTGIVQTTSGVLSTLANGSVGQVLKIVGGAPSWSTDLTGGGSGAAAWATTSNDLAIYPNDPSDVVIIGANATTTAGNILEVTGNALFRNAATSYGLLTAPRFIATSSVASMFPYASTTALSATTLCLSSDCRSAWQESFSTTSADYWQTQRTFFSTTSTDFWKTQNNFFSTTSADYWDIQQTARTADDLTNNSIEDLVDVAAMTESYGDLFVWTGAAWTDFATSSLAIALVDTTGNLGATRGGTGLSSIATAGILIGNYLGTGWEQVSTSTLGLLTTHVVEGSNLYYTDSRVQSFVHASTTIPKLYSSNTWTGPNVFSALTLGSLNGPLQANSGVLSATSSIGVSYGGTGLATGPTYGQLLVGNSSGGYTLTATSSLGISGGGWTNDGTQSYLIDTTDKVGVGTTTPWAKLAIQATGAQTNPLFEVASSSNATKFLSVAGSGFGTTTLSGLTVSGSATSTSNVGFNLSAGCYAVNGTCISGGGASLTGTQGQVAYFSGTNSAVGTSSLFIATSGNVGIGTTTPQYPLTIDSTGATALQISGSSAFFRLAEEGVTEWQMGTNILGAGSGKFALGNGTTRLLVDTSGNVGIGTENPNQGKVEVKGGSVCVDTNSDDNATSCIASESDERLKTNIQAISASTSLEIINALNPVSFDWRATDPTVLSHWPTLGRYAGNEHSIGLIAQEVMPVLPEALSLETVGDDEVQYWQLDYTKFIPHIIGAVKELWLRTQEYFARTEKLESEVDALRARVEELEFWLASLSPAAEQPASELRTMPTSEQNTTPEIGAISAAATSSQESPPDNGERRDEELLHIPKEAANDNLPAPAAEAI